MLTRKQLDDAAKCRLNSNCFKCSLYRCRSCTRELSKTALALLDMLERLEWAGDVDGISGFCQMCGEYKSTGHAADCELADILKRLEWSRLGFCPICGKHEKDEHEWWCELAALLKRLEG